MCAAGSLVHHRARRVVPSWSPSATTALSPGAQRDVPTHDQHAPTRRLRARLRGEPPPHSSATKPASEALVRSPVSPEGQSPHQLQEGSRRGGWCRDLRPPRRGPPSPDTGARVGARRVAILSRPDGRPPPVIAARDRSSTPRSDPRSPRRVIATTEPIPECMHLYLLRLKVAPQGNPSQHPHTPRATRLAVAILGRPEGRPPPQHPCRQPSCSSRRDPGPPIERPPRPRPRGFSRTSNRLRSSVWTRTGSGG